VLEKGLTFGTMVVALTIDDRHWARDDAQTPALTELRGVLLEEHVWRKQTGLA